MRRSGETALAALARVAPGAGDLALWDLLLAEHQVPGAAIPARELRLLAFSLLKTGAREVAVGDSTLWREAVDLTRASGASLRAAGPIAAEVRSYIDCGLLDPGSSRRLLRFASPEVQAVLAAGFLAAEPNRMGDVVEQLAASAAARQAVADALRLDGGGGRVHAALLRAADAGVSRAAEAAGLCLALRHAPATFAPPERGGLARRLALILADRAAGGPALTLSGMREAVAALDRHVPANAEEHLLQALHSSSFPTRLSVALALLRRGPQQALLGTVESWLNAAESPAASGVQHQLGLALWFCPYLRESDPQGSGGDLHERATRLAAAADSNPLMGRTRGAVGNRRAARQPATDRCRDRQRA
jgi:hypothetical protein